MYRTLGILFICGALSACASVPPGGQQVNAVVEQTSDRFWSTRQSGDAAALATQFTEDGILMIPGLPDSAGREAIQSLVQQRAATTQISDFKIQRREIEVLGDTAHELGWFSEVYRGQGPSMRMQGRYSIVWKRGGDNVWRVHRNQYNFAGATPVP